MADIKSPEERSLNMSHIRSCDTKPEVWIRKELFHRGYRYRKNTNKIPGHPDLWLAKYRAAVFVHGCYWHRHENCKYAYTPKSRVEFWTEKFRKNVARDLAVQKELAGLKIRSVIIWECTIRKMRASEQEAASALDRLELFLKSDELKLEL